MINLFSLRRHSCRVGRASDHTVWSLLNFLILPSLSLRAWERAHVNKVVSEQTKVKSDAASPFTTSLTFFWCLNQLKKHFLTDFFLSFLLLSFQISLSAYFAIKNPLNLYKKPIKKSFTLLNTKPWKVMNPLDAQCDTRREDAICVNQLKNARATDPALLQEKPDVKIFLPFRFYLYRPEELFQPNTYNRFLGKNFL